ncbi:uridine phosphorylase-like [Hylaeus volcanicus]|uniref:uridine phosphorylase-like n=1 Tax=Hylaeus volcanicus TaxID=313075 RepID=UPI0023B7CB7C|nr:uridine phosphorylase-like [Hylaeus volcanicus]XP_053991994.1 uridine phosphorylase-like [Hylaeus volcanicus]
MSYFTGKDMFLLPDGSTYHLGVKKGDIFPRIITVGCYTRAKVLSELLDKDKPIRAITSSRDFHIYSGYFNGVGISIIGIGMGSPLMDFMVREATFVQQGPMAIIRFGTCGIFHKDALPGTLMTCGKGSMYVYVNYNHFCGSLDSRQDTSSPYLVTKSIPTSSKLNELLVNEIQKERLKNVDGLNACGETFYSCQARKDQEFYDENEGLMKTLMDAKIDSMDMETHQLFFLSKIRKDPCYVAAALIGIVNRVNLDITTNISADEMHEIVAKGGRCCLEALSKFQL